MQSTRRLLITMAYLDEGIVPPPDIVLDDGDYLRESLESLTFEEARKARRRFRKIFRRAVKWRIAYERASAKNFACSSTRRSRILEDKIQVFKAEVGIDLRPTPCAENPRQQRARRRLVFNYIEYKSSEDA